MLENPGSLREVSQVQLPPPFALPLILNLDFWQGKWDLPSAVPAVRYSPGPGPGSGSPADRVLLPAQGHWAPTDWDSPSSTGAGSAVNRAVLLVNSLPLLHKSQGTVAGAMAALGGKR